MPPRLLPSWVLVGQVTVTASGGGLQRSHDVCDLAFSKCGEEKNENGCGLSASEVFLGRCDCSSRVRTTFTCWSLSAITV